MFSCTAGMSLCLILAFLTLCDVTGPFGSSAFFVNNFRSIWNINPRKTSLCSHWAPKSTNVRPPPSVICDLSGCDLTLASESTLTLTFTKQMHIIRRCLVKGSRGCLSFLAPRRPLLVRVWAKKTIFAHWPDLWDHRLTCYPKIGYESLWLVTSDMLVSIRQYLVQ